jgi:2-C-methyl-D-erythritol 4-phosphate cytidylyltransferase/2-C-methyl-D-erythritol 2,4-cyclodiphosphate synthase
VHAVGGSGDLWLAGLHWPGEPSLHGHSDGDAVAHAIVDAVLAAAGLGIGTISDRSTAVRRRPRRGVPSTRGGWWRPPAFHRQRLGAGAGAPPRFAARRAEAEHALSSALGAPVAVSATTTDGLGYTGTGDGVAAFAVALVYSGEPPRPRRCRVSRAGRLVR